MDRSDVVMISDSPFVPPDSPMRMPVQRFYGWNGQAAGSGRRRVRDTGALIGRLTIALLTAAVTGYALYEMLAIVGFGNATGMQLALVALFLATFFWMALGASNAVLGFVRQILSRGEARPEARPDSAGPRVAVVMPVCNEDPEPVFAALARMGDALAARPWSRRVEFFMLSDTTDPAVGMRELHFVGSLCQRLAGLIPVYYRRRRENEGRKAGNMADFVRRWGGRYDYMIVLDADSYLTSDAVGGLIAAMDNDPRAGLIQASIRLAGRDSLFARLQKFSAVIYGGVANAGFALWHGRDGNFNGHNAILRTSAYAAACGLPELPGGRPFGGHILSHDFVEAALLRRAGWDVYTRLDINGTYEDSPPNLIEFFKRDRRWMQGNLQHARILPADGLHWMNRVHLGFGIMAYLSSLLWLMFLVVGMSIAVYTTLVPQNYFPDPPSLFPTWPIFDAERAYQLTGFVLLIVLLPKILGYADAVTNRETRIAAGGFLPLTLSTGVEVVLAALLAPLNMIVQVVHFVEILLGQDSGWPAQDRRGASVSLRKATRFFRLPSLIGALLAVGSYTISVSLFAWLAPIWAGLLLAIPMAMATGSRSFNQVVQKTGLLEIADEPDGPLAVPSPSAQGRSEPSSAVPQRP